MDYYKYYITYICSSPCLKALSESKMGFRRAELGPLTLKNFMSVRAVSETGQNLFDYGMNDSSHMADNDCQALVHITITLKTD